ncbi:MSMEG_0568 family radical SAM protein [Desulfospira joergensenii]|uniref:MSMEG_0568 family radical SAM protein n=1 Tax=Desulfospira joergensenii TaxID=53329 RepID=UPI0003B5996D|nr:MSMEG_0568 family radical SAM protein [Desulfospira joergensenii]
MHHLITEIQSLGIRVHEDMAGRKGGAGPAEGRAFIVNGIPVSVPLAAAYVSQSPFSLQTPQTPETGYELLKNGKPVSRIRVVEEPEFYSRSTEEGIPYRQIALLHGKDCLATTVLQECVHWKTSQRCSFCATQATLAAKQTLAKKTPLQLAQVAKAARETDGVTHMVLTSGTGDPPGSEISYLAQCVRAIKAHANIPVQVQIAPPKDLGLMEELAHAGVESLGIHIESFDAEILSKVAPAKARIGLDHYEKAWKKAVELFGVNQVSSFIIAGLGEKEGSIAWGSEFLADLGVYPFVVPLRPIPGSRLAKAKPPESDIMKRLYETVARILRDKGLATDKILAGCARCGACSALSSYETKEKELVCHSARNRAERAEAFRIRREVFVLEQGLFDGSDQDENDGDSIHLVARQKKRIIGTVRIYRDPDKTPDKWIGGRLAVEKNFRAGSAGSALVREAMKRVKKKGCREFLAHIQEKNIPFFLHLGWKPVEPVRLHFGRPHQKMQADLTLVPKDA